MKFMKLILVTMLLALAACSDVPTGHVGIKINRYGSDKGVDQSVLGPGRYWLSWNEEIYLFPTYVQNYNWTASSAEGSSNNESITFQSKEGMDINVDIGISYKFDREKITSLFQEYRKGPDEITDVVLRNSVRDYLNKVGSQYSVEEAYSTKKADIVDAVKKNVKNDFSQKGILIENIFLIGSMRLPDPVINAINAKIEATQKAQQSENEVRAAEAEAKKKIATAEGEAKSNRIKMESLTPQLIQYEAVQKWNGQLPQYVGSGAIPFIGMGVQK